MRDQFSRQFDTLVKVSTFGEKCSELFPSSNLSGQLFAVIAESITELRKQDGARSAGIGLTREGATAKAEARAELRDYIMAMSRTARSIGQDQPGIALKFRVPASMAGAKGLLAVARGFAENAAPLAEVFARYELPIEKFNAAIARFEDAIESHAERKRGSTSAATAIITTMDKAMDALYRLDAIVPNKLRDNPSLLQEWEAARRISSAQRSSKTPEQEAEQPVSPPAAAAVS